MAQFVNDGHPAHPARMAFGTLVIKQRLECSDDWGVKHISENPYLQDFIGMKEYSSEQNHWLKNLKSLSKMLLRNLSKN